MTFFTVLFPSSIFFISSASSDPGGCSLVYKSVKCNYKLFPLISNQTCIFTIKAKDIIENASKNCNRSERRFIPENKTCKIFFAFTATWSGFSYKNVTEKNHRIFSSQLMDTKKREGDRKFEILLLSWRCR